MRSRPTNSILTYCFVAFLISAVSGCCPQQPPPTKQVDLFAYPPGAFASTSAILEQFRKAAVPFDLKELRGGEQRYAVVQAYPYSGADTTEVYCFVNRGGKWLIFAKAVLWKTRPKSASFVANGDQVSVIAGGKTVLSFNAPE